MACHIIQLFTVIFPEMDWNTQHMQLCALCLLGVQTTDKQSTIERRHPCMKLSNICTEIKVSFDTACIKLSTPSMSASLMKLNKSKCLSLLTWEADGTL